MYLYLVSIHHSWESTELFVVRAWDIVSVAREMQSLFPDYPMSLMDIQELQPNMQNLDVYYITEINHESE